MGLPPRRWPSTTPPTSPAAAVTTPVATAAFEVPFEPELELRAFEPAERDEALRLPDEELRLPLRLREEELRPRDDAAEDRRLDALAVLRPDALVLFGLLREAEDLPREAEDLLREAEDLPRDAEDLLREPAALPFDEVLRLLLLDALLLFGLGPFELVDPDVRFVWERELAWAIAPP